MVVIPYPLAILATKLTASSPRFSIAEMPVSNLVKAGIALVMIDSIIELSFVSATVAWLHKTAAGSFDIESSSAESGFDIWKLQGKPLHLLADQGHTANGAAGTAFVLVGMGGIMALSLRNRAGTLGRGLYYTWLVLNILALLLTCAALGYVNTLRLKHQGQSINISIARALGGTQKYPDLVWTPQSWFAAVLQLDLHDHGVRRDTQSHLRIMNGWLWNLIPMVIVQFVTTVIVFGDWWESRKAIKTRQGATRRNEKLVDASQA
jgi:hypothetical protein